MSGATMFIDGTWTNGRSTETIQVVSPATGETLADVPSATDADVEAAVASARQGQVALEALGVYRRAELLHAAADVIEREAEAIARDLALEQGKPWRTEAVEEIEETAGNLRMAAEDVKRHGHGRDPQRAARQDDLHVAQAERRLRGDHAVELPDHDPVGADRPGARNRQCRDPEAERVHPARRAAARRDPRGGRPSGPARSASARRPQRGRGARHPSWRRRDRIRRLAQRPARRSSAPRG